MMSNCFVLSVVLSILLRIINGLPLTAQRDDETSQLPPLLNSIETVSSGDEAAADSYTDLPSASRLNRRSVTHISRSTAVKKHTPCFPDKPGVSLNVTNSNLKSGNKWRQANKTMSIGETDLRIGIEVFNEMHPYGSPIEFARPPMIIPYKRRTLERKTEKSLLNELRSLSEAIQIVELLMYHYSADKGHDSQRSIEKLEKLHDALHSARCVTLNTMIQLEMNTNTTLNDANDDAYIQADAADKQQIINRERRHTKVQELAKNLKSVLRRSVRLHLKASTYLRKLACKRC